VALVQDNQGAFFSLLHNSAGDPKGSAPRNGEWMWAELWTTNPKEAVSFYTDVLAITAKPYSDNEVENYFILKGDTYEFGGITEIPVKNEEPIWIPVLRVANAETIAKKAVELDGSILINPVEVSGKKVALIATPSGAPFLIQDWKD
jgi:predicted enzyme related to lactoylglutathione lyase